MIPSPNFSVMLSHISVTRLLGQRAATRRQCCLQLASWDFFFSGGGSIYEAEKIGENFRSKPSDRIGGCMAYLAVIKGSGGDAKVKPPGQGKEYGGGGFLRAKVVAVPPEGKKKAEESGKKSLSLTQKSVAVVSKQVKGRTVTKTVTKIVNAKTTSVKVKAVKKVYTLPGQKHDHPEEREPLRIFYESLSKQIPSSEMAEFWMMEHGLLSIEKAKRANERKHKRQQQQRMGTPIKPPKQARTGSSNKPQVSRNGDAKAKKRVKYSDDDEDDHDFIVKHKKSK